MSVSRTTVITMLLAGGLAGLLALRRRWVPAHRAFPVPLSLDRRLHWLRRHHRCSARPLTALGNRARRLAVRRLACRWPGYAKHCSDATHADNSAAGTDRARCGARAGHEDRALPAASQESGARAGSSKEDWSCKGGRPLVPDVHNTREHANSVDIEQLRGARRSSPRRNAPKRRRASPRGAHRGRRRTPPDRPGIHHRQCPVCAIRRFDAVQLPTVTVPGFTTVLVCALLCLAARSATCPAGCAVAGRCWRLWLRWLSSWAS